MESPSTKPADFRAQRKGLPLYGLFIMGSASTIKWLPCEINGGRAIQLRMNGEIAAAITFAYNDEGKATNIYIMRNPD